MAQPDHKMTREQKQIKIAEACGWTWGEPYNKLQALFKAPDGYQSPLWSSKEPVLWSDNGRTLEELRLDLISGLPDYFNDLNACHEMEKHVDDWGEYIVHLKCVSNDLSYDDFQWPILGFDAFELSDITHATAAQRAEAFGRTLNLW